MEIYRSVDEVPDNFGPSAVTVGKFDGVHLGHQEMISWLLQDAGVEGLIPTALTFDRNPLSVLAPDRCPPALISNQQKFELLADYGLVATLMLTFDQAQSQQSAEDFVEQIVFRKLGAKIVYAGPDFRYGKGGRGNIELLDSMGKQLGFTVKHVPEIESSGRRISSTWIRELLAEGDVAGAAKLLGRLHTIRSTVSQVVVSDSGDGPEKIDLSLPVEGLTPAEGDYEGRLHRGIDVLPVRIRVSKSRTSSDDLQVTLNEGKLSGISIGESVSLDFENRI